MNLAETERGKLFLSWVREYRGPRTCEECSRILSDFDGEDFAPLDVVQAAMWRESGGIDDLIRMGSLHFNSD